MLSSLKRFKFSTSLMSSSVNFSVMRPYPKLIRPLKLVVSQFVGRHCCQREYLRSGGSLKLRLVPSTKRNKDNKTFNHTSTPPDANIVLVAVWHSPHFILSCVFRSLVRLKNLFFSSIFSFFKYLKSNFSPCFICRFNIVYSRRHFFH